MALEISYNELFKKQNKGLIPDSYRKAVISAVNVNARTADISFVRNPDTVIKSVPFSASVAVTVNLVGQRCKVDIFDEVNAKDMVIAYVYASTAGSVTGFTGNITYVKAVTQDPGTGVISVTSGIMTFSNGTLVAVT